MENSFIKSKTGCHGNKLDKIMPKFSIFHKFLNLTYFGTILHRSINFVLTPLFVGPWNSNFAHRQMFINIVQ